MFEGLMAILPLVGKVAPLITGMTAALASPVANTVLGKAMDIAGKVFGTTDPTSIEVQIQQDKTKLEMFRVQLEEQTKEDLAFVADAQNARNMTLEMMRSGSKMAWGAPMMTAAVTTGFFLLMLLVLWVNFDNLNDYQKTTIGIIVGALVGAFNQAVNFWLGSTRQSKDKDNVLASLAMTTTASAANTAAGAAANGGRTFR
jgi:hypothetical protein